MEIPYYLSFEFDEDKLDYELGTKGEVPNCLVKRVYQDIDIEKIDYMINGEKWSWKCCEDMEDKRLWAVCDKDLSKFPEELMYYIIRNYEGNPVSKYEITQSAKERKEKEKREEEKRKRIRVAKRRQRHNKKPQFSIRKKFSQLTFSGNEPDKEKKKKSTNNKKKKNKKKLRCGGSKSIQLPSTIASSSQKTTSP